MDILAESDEEREQSPPPAAGGGGGGGGGSTSGGGGGGGDAGSAQRVPQPKPETHYGIGTKIMGHFEDPSGAETDILGEIVDSCLIMRSDKITGYQYDIKWEGSEKIHDKVDLVGGKGRAPQISWTMLNEVVRPADETIAGPKRHRSRMSGVADDAERI